MPLKLELWMVVSHWVGSGNQVWTPLQEWPVLFLNSGAILHPRPLFLICSNSWSWLFNKNLLKKLSFSTFNLKGFFFLNKTVIIPSNFLIYGTFYFLWLTIYSSDCELTCEREVDNFPSLTWHGLILENCKKGWWHCHWYLILLFRDPHYAVVYLSVYSIHNSRSKLLTMTFHLMPSWVLIWNLSQIPFSFFTNRAGSSLLIHSLYTTRFYQTRETKA